jgi:hypothetical protein
MEHLREQEGAVLQVISQQTEGLQPRSEIKGTSSPKLDLKSY